MNESVYSTISPVKGFRDTSGRLQSSPPVLASGSEPGYATLFIFVFIETSKISALN